MKNVFIVPFFLLLLPSLGAQITTASLWTWVKGDSALNGKGIYGKLGSPAETSKPGGRRHSVTWTDASGDLWLFGGFGYARNSDSSGRLNDLWKYNPSTNKWTWIKGDNMINQPGHYGTKGTAGSTNKPGAREGSITWTDASGNFWLFGGYGYDATHYDGNSFGPLNDLWKYNPVASQWTWIPEIL